MMHVPWTPYGMMESGPDPGDLVFSFRRLHTLLVPRLFVVFLRIFRRRMSLRSQWKTHLAREI